MTTVFRGVLKAMVGSCKSRGLLPCLRTFRIGDMAVSLSATVSNDDEPHLRRQSAACVESLIKGLQSELNRGSHAVPEDQAGPGDSLKQERKCTPFEALQRWVLDQLEELYKLRSRSRFAKCLVVTISCQPPFGHVLRRILCLNSKTKPVETGDSPKIDDAWLKEQYLY